MYADRLESESGSRNTVKDRINGGSGDNSTRSRQVTGKRQRQDDKWEHDLFSSDKPQLSSRRRVDSRDLRLKLQKRDDGSQSGRGGGSGVRDLREKLSGTMTVQPKNSDPLKSKVEAAARPSMKSVATDTETDRKASSQATRKKSQQAGGSVDSFLESLGLEKYSTAFKVEEVDMDALIHMTDDDLKAMLIPMGPRKKILLALGSKR
ncbi:ankyrin repeat and SAM domain-containing protein 6 isoform X1 [Brassica rapa]|uniref:ankyrin repeat and SAM domain-containing protein 6 isoform X1 n=1 Tax=Brassica campestris TaxID=3711 RepID=UPI0004F17C46|nr:ankyrin repeat and SAM domain-containing protein 6 isoform X1 [Brassica rapa]